MPSHLNVGMGGDGYCRSRPEQLCYSNAGQPCYPFMQISTLLVALLRFTPSCPPQAETTKMDVRDSRLAPSRGPYICIEEDTSHLRPLRKRKRDATIWSPIIPWLSFVMCGLVSFHRIVKRRPGGKWRLRGRGQEKNKNSSALNPVLTADCGNMCQNLSTYAHDTRPLSGLAYGICWYGG